MNNRPPGRKRFATTPAHRRTSGSQHSAPIPVKTRSNPSEPSSSAASQTSASTNSTSAPTFSRPRATLPPSMASGWRSTGGAAYGAGALLDTLERADANVMCKVQPPVAPGGRYAKDAFTIDLQAGTVICPAGQLAPLRALRDGQVARFGAACASCPLAERCTTATDGRTIHVGPYEAQLARARQRQADPAWKADYTATRPKVERKIAHLMRRKHGGRRARVRGQTKVDADFALLAAAVNLARLAALGLTHRGGAGWAANTA